MRSEFRSRWISEIGKASGGLKKPADLLHRAISSEDFVDSAVIGGQSVGEILAGRVSEGQIPSDVKAAFHAQYPQHGSSFVEAVRHLSRHPQQVAGLVNGVKGKLFELHYLDWLNHGHLPAGFTAELAANANNPAWDIAVRDSHGHVNEFLQLKAPASLSHVREAIAAHPDIDVIVPHGLYQNAATHPELFEHIVDSHQTLDHLTNQVGDAAIHAEAGLAFHVPVLAIGFAVVQNCRRYRNGNVDLKQALKGIGERSGLAVFATAAGWGAKLLMHEPLVGLSVSVVARLVGGQVLHNIHRREYLNGAISRVTNSRICLEVSLNRPLLGSVAELSTKF